MNVAIKPDGSFDSGVVTITGDGAYHDVATIQADGKPIRFQGTVGAVALNGLKVLQSEAHDGPGVEGPIFFSNPVNPRNAAASTSFLIIMKSGAADYTVQAKSAGADTTVQLVGRVLPIGSV